MKTKRRSLLRAGPLALLLAGLTSPVLAQVSASVTGTVTDHTGAVLAKASVAAVSRDTGVEYPTKSNDAGVYVIQGLPIGHYVVKAASAGFKPLTTNAITLETGQTAKVNLKLELGAVTEQIEVVGVNPILQTENAVVGEVISGSTVLAMPLNGRNFSSLALLVPGVQTHAPDTFNNPKQGTDSGRPYVNGQREQANNYTIDGIDMNEAVDNTVAYYPSPDSIAEMKIETNNYSAEFGNAAGGIISAVIRSGSNELHGGLFEFGRNDAFDANSWSNNRSGASKAKLKQNIFGATLSGPIAKNKLFFFADYQGQIVSQPGAGTASVAPAAWRNGDFSGLSIPIIDPLTGKQFPGNVIPRNRISPVANNLFANTTNYPLPNRNVDPALGNYVHDQEQGTHNHQGDLKINANLGPNDNMFVRGTVGHYNIGTVQPVYPLQFGGTFVSDVQNVAVNWTHTFGPTAVNEARVGFNHNTFNDSPGDPAGVGNYNAVIGIPGGQAIPGLANLGFDGGGISGVGTAGGGHNANNKVYQFSEKLSFSKDRHFLSVGGSFLHYNMTQLYDTNSGVLGQYFFDGTVTGLPFADFLLDRVARKSVAVTDTGTPLQPWTQLQNRIGLFIQDDFKPTANLTLNLGLHWEYSSQLKEANNRQENFDLTNGGVRISATDSNPTAGLKNYYGGFAPRLGFAWSATPRTVVRGGFAIVRYMEGTGANCRLTLNPTFGVDTLQTYAGSTGSMAEGFSDVPPSTQVRAWQLDIEPQLTKQWNVFLQHELTNTMSVNVGYVGSRATHVVAFDNANQPTNSLGSGPVPFPQLAFIRYTSDAAVANYDALQASVRRRKSNGLEFLASYTFSKALTDNQGFYGPGWNGSRSADQNTVGFFGDGNTDFYNKTLDYGRPWFSAKHTASLSIIYDLPIGKDRSVGKDWSGVTQALLGGWNVSGILTVRSGLPVTVTNGWGLPFMQTRPDIVGDPKPTNQDWNSWISPTAFANPAPSTYGNSGVGIMDGPGFYNLDAGLDKAFQLGGTRALTFRLEAFNVLNHPNKGLPNRNWGDPSTFGTITQTANGQRIVEFVIRFAF
jgi:hypothetical protein